MAGVATAVSAEDRAKWDARYAEGAYDERPHPSAFLRDCLEGGALPAPDRALDLACGAGRNAIYLAQNGWTVDAVDISPVALERARQRSGEGAQLAIHYLEQDLDAGFAGTGRYDLIVNIRYVNLPLLHTLIDRLRPGGALLVEQHLAPAEGSFLRGAGSFFRGASPSRSPAEGSSRSPAEGSCLRGAGPSRSPAEGSGATIVGPRNPAFRVAPGSLRHLARGLLVQRSQEGLVREPDGTLAALAQLVAFAPAAERDGCNRPTPAYDAPP